MKYTLGTTVHRHRYGHSGEDALLGFDFECPFVPFVGLEVSVRGGDGEGKIERAWWEADAQVLHLYTQGVRVVYGDVEDDDGALFELMVGQYLERGYRPLNEVARRVADASTG